MRGCRLSLLRSVSRCPAPLAPLPRGAVSGGAENGGVFLGVGGRVGVGLCAGEKREWNGTGVGEWKELASSLFFRDETIHVSKDAETMTQG